MGNETFYGDGLTPELECGKTRSTANKKLFYLSAAKFTSSIGLC